MNDGWLYRCPQSHFILKVVNDGHGSEHADGIEIKAGPSFGGRLLAYLQSPDMPRACSNGLGTAGRFEAHKQIRRSEFRSRQSAPTEDLVHPRLVGSARVALATLEAVTPRRVAWGEILGDAMVAAALIDRLIHYGTMVTLKGKSYRLRERGTATTPAARTAPLEN